MVTVVQGSRSKFLPSSRHRNTHSKQMFEENRHHMMQNLFGDPSEEEAEELNSEHDRSCDMIIYPIKGRVEAGGRLKGEAEIKGQGKTEVENDVIMHDVDPDPGESKGV